MLRSLSIRDFVIVQALDLDFADRFTVFTGETGAGKSILIDALALTLGTRGDAGVVREGAQRADISAEFTTDPAIDAWLEEAALEGDPGVVLLRRTIDAGGRSKAFINGASATLTQLRELGEQLVDIHGQHAHQLLLKPEAQRHLLDAHAGLEQQVAEVESRYRAWRALGKQRELAERHARELQLERERIEWQVNELEKLAPQPDEWTQVQQEHNRLSHAANLIDGARSALDTLSESDDALQSRLSGIIHRLQGLADVDPALQDVLAALEPAQVQIGEAVHSLSRYAGRLDLDPDRLAEIDSRMQALHATAKKYRVEPDHLHAELSDRKVRLAELDAAQDLEALSASEAAARQQYMAAARTLGKARKQAAGALSTAVTDAMQGLSMSGGRFDVALQPLEEGQSYGLEQVEFLVAGHAGVTPRPLAKVASGGELARISLAISVITSQAATNPTLIFDEVDSGIGGAVADVVGQRLRELGQARQVLCVTHLPQVAARADHHFLVSKDTVAGITRSQIAALDSASRVSEIARMLGGATVTDASRQHAHEMLTLPVVTDTAIDTDTTSRRRAARRRTG